ncbi:neutral zinc metallopeptidase [Lentibacter algarum]|uniref:KPN_02809 family neutral zinc metallopeptidase n=1 Tax=Lentibacter algarum TaxID=576131 RepID=UPI001C07D205|nr:neutral zinc metallopeptidase [Lentibacter algarum]MBU2981513.1 neutral zinc metallopeptidase [Lentibacter algarum]
MRLRGVRKSRNVEDRRKMSGGKGAGLGGVGLLVVLAVGYFAGIDVTPLLEGQGGIGQQSTASRELTEAEQREGEFAAGVLSTTEQVWGQVFPQIADKAYQPPVMVLYSGVTSSPCGNASGATGPFYCPGDEKFYLDTAFFTTMRQKLGAGGDFAAAYVIAHEVAHHVQNELGILPKVNQRRQAVGQTEANALTVRLELQADCLSGVWARAVSSTLERGDLQEALNAAKQIGDDTLQRNAGRVPQPHTFTHGTSEQRQRWFSVGYKSGDANSCDTFSAARL